MPRDRLFDPVVPEHRLHPNVARLRLDPSAEPTRLMMEEIFAALGRLADGNFVEQFQTSGFDARVFELFLFAYFSSIDAKIERITERPDYLVTRNGLTVAVEATTANPTQVPGTVAPVITGVDLKAFMEEDENQRLVRMQQELPVRLGGALFSKLGKEYWKLPHVKQRPLIFAIEPFHAHDALLFSSTGIAEYLYGVRQSRRHGDAGELRIDTTVVAQHQLGAKNIPSNFFALEGAEYVSAVLYTNAGSVSKFTRMGYQAGLHRGNVLVMRQGSAWNSDPNAAEALQFRYRLDEDSGDEPWGSGVEIFHNPRALHPIPDEFFGAAVHTHFANGVPVSYLPAFSPFFSLTHRVHLTLDSLTAVEFSKVGVGTILRREFDALNPERPPYHSGEFPFSEIAWFADRARNVAGTILRWHGREEYGLVVLGRDERGHWRAIDAGGEYTSLDSAASEMLARLKYLSETDESVFPQND